MPEPLHPPYGITQPRQLNRWLDINSQNGSLTRTRGVVTVPDVTTYTGSQHFPAYIGYSEKYFQYNYVASGKFSFVMDATFQQWIAAWAPHADVIIAMIVNPTGVSELNTITRYRLTPAEGAGSIDAIQYEGQPINALFQIEFWNSPTANAFQLPIGTYILSSSILGNVDYRYGDDFNIHATAPEPVTEFNDDSGQSAPGTFNLPLTFPSNTTNNVRNFPS